MTSRGHGFCGKRKGGPQEEGPGVKNCVKSLMDDSYLEKKTFRTNNLARREKHFLNLEFCEVNRLSLFPSSFKLPLFKVFKDSSASCPRNILGDPEAT